MSLRDRIIAVDDLQREIVKIEQWGLDVEIRGMSGAARAAIVQDAADNNGNINFAKMMPEVVIGCVFDCSIHSLILVIFQTRTGEFK